jgi:hypothetical protein
MSFNTGTLINNLAKSKLSNPATADLDLQNTFKIKNSVEPVLNTDLATKNYVDVVAGGGGASTGSLPFSLVASSNVIGQFTNPSGNDLQLSAPTSTGKLIFTDIHGVDFTNSPATFTNTSGNVITVSPSGATKGIRINGNNDANQPLFEISSSAGERHFTSIRSGVVQQSQIYVGDTTTGGLTMVELSKAGNGKGIDLIKSGTGNALHITNNGSGKAITTTFNAGAGGTNGDIEINGTSSLLGLVDITAGGNSNTLDITKNSGTGDAVAIVNSGTGGALNISGAGSSSLVINKTSGAGNCVSITNSGTGLLASLSSTGTGITYNHTNTGAIDGLTYTKSGGTGGILANLTYSNSGSDDVVRITRNSGGASGNLINLINNTAGVMINSSQSGTGVNISANNTANSGSSNNVEFVKSGTGNGNNVFIRNVDTVGASTGIALSILNQGIADCLRIQDEAGDTSLFRVDADGNVGIGVSTSGLTNKFESNAGTGTTTTQIAQTTTTNALTVSDSSLGTSRIFLNTTGAEVTGRSDILLEPSRGTAGVGTTPRIRMTVASGSNNGILLQGNNATAGTNFRFGFTSGSTAETTLNIYADGATRRMRLGNQDIYAGIPNGVLEITRNATPHGTSIPHILLNGANASGGVVMNCNSGRIEALADPVNPQDAATRAYVLANSGGTATAFTLSSGTSGNANSQPIINLSTPTSIIDNTTNKALAVNKEFVEKIQQAPVGRWFSSWNQSYTYNTSPIFWTTPNTGSPISVDVDGASTPNTGWYAEVIGTNFTSQYCYLDSVPNAFGSGRNIWCWRPRFIDSIFKITVNMTMPNGVVSWNVNTIYWNGSPNNVARYGFPKMWIPNNDNNNRSISFTRYFKFLTSEDYITIVDDSTFLPQTITTGVETSPQSSNGWEVIIEYIGRS